jgi:spore maturation protein CgeB
VTNVSLIGERCTLKILLAIMKFDYGNTSNGYSYEYINYHSSLVEMGHEVILFDYMSEIKLHGKDKMNEMVLTLAENYRPDLAIFHLYTDQFEFETIKKLRKYTTTLSIFHDDTWRTDYAISWAKCFDFFSTPDYFSLRKYCSLGLRNVILFPYGCNEHLYKKIDKPKIYDVSFVGRWHPYRQWLVDRIERAGISINVRGPGWKGGMVEHDEMVLIFNQSRINLNFSNSASWDARYLCSSLRALVDRFRSNKIVEQLKARHFEINGCGGFQLSYYVSGLERHYLVGDEIAIYGDTEDLVEKIKYYLVNEDIRETIATAGYQRTLLDHTFNKNFNNVFNKMGLIDVR